MKGIIYNRWCSLRRRSLSENFKKDKTTYKDVTICEEWLDFKTFSKWFEENWKFEYMDSSWQLDKDILVKGNKIYSPETCCFVPHEINSLFMSTIKIRGLYPIGVNKEREKYRVRIGGNRKHIGIFDTPEEAFEAYKIAKEAHIKEVANKWRGKITEEVYEAMYKYEVEIND